MSRYPSGVASTGPFPASAPSEALLFARAITGNPLPGSATEGAGARIDCEYLEWLAAISPEYEWRLRNLAKKQPGDEPRREQLEWLATISPRHARQLQELRREEASAAEERERSRRIIERLELERAAEEEWDASKHPRAGGPPNAGWFVSTGSSGAIAPLPANPSPKPDSMARPPRQQDQFAQAQQPAQGGQQADKPVNPAVRGKFGTWPARPAGFVPAEIRDNGMHSAVQRRMKNAHSALPVLVRGTLRNNGHDAVPNIAALNAKEQHYLSKPSEAFAEAIARIVEKKDPGMLRNSVQYLNT